MCIRDSLGTVLEVNPISGYLRVRCGTEAFAPRYYKVSVCEYISGGKRAPRRPDPDDDYSGVRNPAQMCIRDRFQMLLRTEPLCSACLKDTAFCTENQVPAFLLKCIFVASFRPV